MVATAIGRVTVREECVLATILGWPGTLDNDDRKYDDELKDATAFAKRHELGVWDLCGAFG